MKIPHAFILAGGLGTRLRSVVADRPKPVALIHGRPFLAYLLDQIAEAGVQTAVLCTGHQAEKVRESFGSSWRDMKIEYSEETEPLGTGGALRLAWERFPCEQALVLNGDSYCHADLKAFALSAHASSAIACMLVVSKEDCRRYGRVEIDDKDRVIQFAEKSETLQQGWINAGIYAVRQAHILPFPCHRPFSLERDAFPLWLTHGIQAVRTDGAFIDIGTPESYQLAETFFRPA